MNSVLIIQFAKWPHLGKVKTRLAASIGEKRALEVHVSLMNIVLDNILAVNTANVELWLDQYDTDNEEVLPTIRETLLKHNSNYKIQCEGSLGDKMADAFQRRLSKYSKVIIVGSDCPTVNEHYLSQAITALDDHDMVLGPAEDGGYVLIGASRFKPDIFTDIVWGENKVLERTLSNAQDLGFRIKALETTWDIDDFSDYKRWLHYQQSY